MAKRGGSILPFLLWWTSFFILWYAGVTMWIAALVSFVVGWIFGRALEKLGLAIITYDISFGQPLLDLSVNFTLSRWKKCLAFLFPRRIEEIKAEIRYFYEEQEQFPKDTFPKIPLWQETGNPTLLVETEGLRHIEVFKITDDGRPMTIDNRPLPNKFDLQVSIKTLTGTLRKELTTTLEVD